MTQPQLPTGNIWRTQELLSAGFHARAVARLTRSGDLVRARRGCYVRGSWWNGLKPGIRSRYLIHTHAHGTLTTSAGGFVYSHTSGARLRRLHLWKADGRIHLTQQTCPSRISHGSDVVAHTRALGPDDISFVDGLPCTSLERTVVDCCLMFNLRQSLILVDHACRMGADLEALRSRCTGLAGRNGVVALRRAIELADPRSESPGETLTRELLHRLRIEPPEPQYVVNTPLGQHRLDFAWRKRKVALEFDGRTKYFDYQPTDEVLFAERRREKALMEQGWIFLRIEWKDLFNEAEFKYRVLRALARGTAGQP
ncbi:type IV toxin-antitoxin system AbiEi family antitoxin domain-containing protein [Arthrobacter oryzae]|uniref:type IV toxin-antitoxin system AbiEi family antitoxin domain-containing protein n=1 Tax=Arthrobacter oryzae TaxID=409290 RepID=UPI00285C83C2|nr:type IV toxin-antitoxin system AbiEi family antitoxin domain-containing protein [Arthrobacter oryzae]MDR6506196.1 very-short-patch-repair endonuclease [Arthrobacter oryzae]